MRKNQFKSYLTADWLTFWLLWFYPPPTRFCGPLIKTVATVSSWCWDKDLDMSSLYFWKCLLLYTSTYLQVHVDKSEEKRREDSERKEKKEPNSHIHHNTHFSVRNLKKKKKSLPHGNTPTHHHADALKANHTHTATDTRILNAAKHTRQTALLSDIWTNTHWKQTQSLTDSFF